MKKLISLVPEIGKEGADRAEQLYKGYRLVGFGKYAAYLAAVVCVIAPDGAVVLKNDLSLNSSVSYAEDLLDRAGLARPLWMRVCERLKRIFFEGYPS